MSLNFISESNHWITPLICLLVYLDISLTPSLLNFFKNGKDFKKFHLSRKWVLASISVALFMYCILRDGDFLNGQGIVITIICAVPMLLFMVMEFICDAKERGVKLEFDLKNKTFSVESSIEHVEEEVKEIVVDNGVRPTASKRRSSVKSPVKSVKPIKSARSVKSLKKR